MCHKHYYRNRTGGGERSEDTSPIQDCSVSHCSRQALSRSDGALCPAHYNVSNIQCRDPEVVVLGPDENICWLENCFRAATHKGLCKTHYARAREGKIETPPEMGIVLNAACSFDGCETISVTSGLCSGHYAQKKKGMELRPLKEWGVYPSGEATCRIPSCQLPAKQSRMCRRHAHVKNHYNLTDERVEDLTTRTKCDNVGCDSTENLHIDHDHKTGGVRGVLCVGCNTALGSLGESIERMEGLKLYKQKHSEPVEVRVFDLGGDDG